MTDAYEEITDIVHVDWPSSNLDRTIAFYESVCGWTFERRDNVAYCRNTVNHIGAFHLVHEKPRFGDWPRPFVAVTSIERSLEAVTAGGGEVVRGKGPLEGIGWTATFSDPDGNVLGLVEFEGGR